MSMYLFSSLTVPQIMLNRNFGLELLNIEEHYSHEGHKGLIEVIICVRFYTRMIIINIRACRS